MLTELAVDLHRAAADREDEVVAVIGEERVARVAGVAASLERESQHARLVAQCRVHHVL